MVGLRADGGKSLRQDVGRFSSVVRLPMPAHGTCRGLARGAGTRPEPVAGLPGAPTGAGVRGALHRAGTGDHRSGFMAAAGRRRGRPRSVGTAVRRAGLLRAASDVLAVLLGLHPPLLARAGGLRGPRHRVVAVRALPHGRSRPRRHARRAARVQRPGHRALAVDRRAAGGRGRRPCAPAAHGLPVGGRPAAVGRRPAPVRRRSTHGTHAAAHRRDGGDAGGQHHGDPHRQAHLRRAPGPDGRRLADGLLDGLGGPVAPRRAQRHRRATCGLRP